MSSAVHILRRGWTWWTGELAGLIPEGLRRPLAGRASAVVVTMARQGPRLVVDDVLIRGRRASSGKVGIEAQPDAWSALSHLARTTPELRVTLRLPRDACFIRRVEVPLAARADVRRLLLLDMERATPFMPKDVYTAHMWDPAPARSGLATALQVIARRPEVDLAVEEVEACGARVVAVDCWDEAGSGGLPVNLLAGAVGEAARGPARSRLVPSLALTAAALAVAAVPLTLSRYEEALARVTAATDAAAAEMRELRLAGDAANDARRDSIVVRQLKSDRVPVVEVLVELTRLVPDGAWLTAIRIGADVVDISGFARPAAALVPGLEGSELFRDVAFTAPVTLDANEGKERFSLRMRVKQAVLRAGAEAGSGEPAP